MAAAAARSAAEPPALLAPGEDLGTFNGMIAPCAADPVPRIALEPPAGARLAPPAAGLIGCHGWLIPVSLEFEPGEPLTVNQSSDWPLLRAGDAEPAPAAGIARPARARVRPHGRTDHDRNQVGRGRAGRIGPTLSLLLGALDQREHVRCIARCARVNQPKVAEAGMAARLNPRTLIGSVIVFRSSSLSSRSTRVLSWSLLFSQ